MIQIKLGSIVFKLVHLSLKTRLISSFLRDSYWIELLSHRHREGLRLGELEGVGHRRKLRRRPEVRHIVLLKLDGRHRQYPLLKRHHIWQWLLLKRIRHGEEVVEGRNGLVFGEWHLLEMLQVRVLPLRVIISLSIHYKY